MSAIAHGIRSLGVLGAGQMGASFPVLKLAHLHPLTHSHCYILGLGIAYVSAVHARVPVVIHDPSPSQLSKSLGLMDKLLAKDVSKGKLAAEQAKEARERVEIVDGIEEMAKKGIDMVVEVRMWL